MRATRTAPRSIAPSFGLSRIGRGPRARLALSVALALVAGCAQYTVNSRLEVPEVIEPPPAEGSEGPNELLLVLAFSGGGKRAAALSFGVLEALAAVEIGAGEGSYRLLDEVDIISSVSGGSFTAAYYGLHGDQGFADYSERFLKRSQRAAGLLRLLLPWNLARVASPWYGRSDLVAEYYDSILFDGATFADVWARGGPEIRIQASDITQGTRFEFTPEQFGLICSDLGSFPVARAVAASAAFPVMLSPITLRNYGGGCALDEPAWIAEALAERDTTSRRYYNALHAHAYRDAEAKRYVHLLDGGVTDNLGLRGIINEAIARGSLWRMMSERGLEQTRRVAFVIVNAQNRVRREWGLFAETPGSAQIADAVTSMLINRYNFETVEQLKQSIELWSRDIGTGRAEGTAGIDFYLVEVSFDALRDPSSREFLAGLPTTMALDPDTIDMLREAGRRILFESESFGRLVSDLGGTLE